MTRVTVAMPIYNAMAYLPEAIASLFAQTLEEFVLIAVDDCSTDGSFEYLQSLNDPRLRILQTNGRQGQGAARNMVLAACDTEYLAFADADDLSLPERLREQVAYMDQHPAVGMLGTHFSFLAANGRTGMTPSLALEHDAIRRDLLIGTHAVANFTLLFRTQVLRDVRGFRIDGAGEDWDLFLRVTEHAKAANLPAVLCLYRLHASSTTIKQALTLHNRYAHACECAELRSAFKQETTFEDFCSRQAARPLYLRIEGRMCVASGLQYRKAILDILENRRLLGYGRLAVAALLNPQKLRERVMREMRARLSPTRDGAEHGVSVADDPKEAIL